MLSLRLLTFLSRLVSVALCWIILMGVPLLFFERPLPADSVKPFLGLFYALMLLTGVVIARSWGGRGLVFMAFPFLLLFSILALRAVFHEAPWGMDQLGALNFLAIYLVVWLAWRIGKRWPGPRIDDEPEPDDLTTG